MALYLGNQKVCPIVYKEIQNNHLTGKIMSDENGIITFPALSFEPKLIAVWNVTQVDQWEEGSPDEYAIQYLTTGVMLFAINTDGKWITQSLFDCSGSIYIANASAEGGHVQPNDQDQGYAPSNIGFDGNNYCYYLHRRSTSLDSLENSYYDITNTEFNYAIYG